MTGPADIETCTQLAVALRAGQDASAASIAERAGIPFVLLTCWAFGPRDTVGLDDAATALSCMSALAAGVPTPVRELSGPAVLDLVADAVEIVAEPDTGHPWLPASRRWTEETARASGISCWRVRRRGAGTATRPGC